METTDPITHGLIGAALSTLSGHPIRLNDPVFLGCTIGAMLPDLDIITHFKGRLNYLLKHRGASHSILSLGVMAFGLSSVLYGFFPTTPLNTILFWTYIGTLSHGITDLLNSFGAELLWPFIRKKFTIDMIMLTDPVIFALFFVSLYISLKTPSLAKTSTLTAITFNVLYLFHREIGRLKTRISLISRYNLQDSDKIKVLPAMYRPFNWNFLILQEKLVLFGTIRHHNPVILRVLPRMKMDDPLLANALDGNLAEIFEKFTPYYHVLAEKGKNEEELKVEFLDLRYWTKGDFLYTGSVVINAEGEIEEEMFYPTQNQEGILLGY